MKRVIVYHENQQVNEFYELRRETGEYLNVDRETGEEWERGSYEVRVLQHDMSMIDGLYGQFIKY